MHAQGIVGQAGGGHGRGYVAADVGFPHQHDPAGRLGFGASGADWVVSAAMVKRLGSLGTRANPQPEPKTESLGWTDLLAQLTPAEVERIGHGWSLKNGQLVSPDKAFAIMPLPGDLSGTSYQVRVKPRRNGYWRAELAAAPTTQAASAEDAPAAAAQPAIDQGTGSERISVRSQTKTYLAKPSR